MYETQIVAWMVGRTDPTEERDRIHRIALAEARIADAHRSAARPAPPSPSARFVLTTGGGGSAVAECCPA